MSNETVIAGALGVLVEAAGGVDAAALAWGVDRTSIWRWGTGRTRPIPAIQRAINAWARRHGHRPLAWG